MSLSDITKELLKIYNKKFDENDREEQNLEKQLETDEKLIAEKYNALLLCCDTTYKPPINYDSDDDDIDPVKMYERSHKPKFDDKNKDLCNFICKVNYIEDKTFVNKMMIYRVAEIEKQLMFIKYNIEVYKYILTGILNLQYKKAAGIKTSSDIDADIADLISQKLKVKDYLEKYVIESEKYILNTSICKFLFLQDRYKKLVNSEDTPIL